MPPKSTFGWLPIDIGFDPQPTVIREALVRWMEFGSTPLAEPFLYHTIDRLQNAQPRAREIETDLETLLRVGSRLPPVRPAGFIFHVSRCGSTLIANALKTSDRALVVSESRPVTHLLRPRSEAVGAYLTGRWDETRRALLNSLFSLFAHYRLGQAEPLVIKFMSINILCLRLVRSYWPDVPCVVVIRDPVEVMVSSLPGGGWMSFKQRPEQAREMFGWPEESRTSADMTDEEFAARVLGRYCASALEAVDDKCMVVDYVELNPGRMRDIASFFGIELPAGEERFHEVFSSYAKDPKKTARFKDDRELKQRRASVLVRSAANRWAMDSYSELRKRTRRV